MASTNNNPRPIENKEGALAQAIVDAKKKGETKLDGNKEVKVEGKPAPTKK